MVDPILLLASNSPRRRQLLSLADWKFDLHPVEIDETPLAGEVPEKYVLRLAEAKARAAGMENSQAGIILAADTTVADGEIILGKPVDEAEARDMLAQLRGRTHQVYTALAVYCPGDDRLLKDLCCTQVSMRLYSEEEINAYIASGDPVDKAGAYAIQHAGFHPVERLEGCYTNVVGLPLCLLQTLLEKVGLPPKTGLPQCPDDVQNCPICCAILRGEYEI